MNRVKEFRKEKKDVSARVGQSHRGIAANYQYD